MAPVPALYFKEVKVISILKGKTHKFTLSETAVWKIESVGIGGTTGTVFLLNDKLTGVPEPVALLYSLVNEQNFGSQLPFWLSPAFDGSFLNDSSFSASVSITIYTTEDPAV